MTPEMITAICAVVTLVIYFTGTIAGAVIFLWKKIDGVKAELLADVKTKHDENRMRVDAMQTLIIKHDTILSPEWNGHATYRHAP